MDASFLKATAERALKTFVQTYFALFLVGDVALNVFQFDWLGEGLGVSLGAALLSVVTSVLSGFVGNQGPSLASETVTPDHSVGPHYGDL